MMAKTDILSR